MAEFLLCVYIISLLALEIPICILSAPDCPLHVGHGSIGVVYIFCICRGEFVAEIFGWVGVIYHIRTRFFDHHYIPHSWETLVNL
jgi:hypothetical protein